MKYTQSKGNLVELQCISKFIELGYEVSIPYGNNAKYDFIADVNGELLRIQCKSATQVKKKDGSIDAAFMFSCSAQTTNTQKTIRHTYTKEQIDYFATCWDNKVYLIPVEECSTAKTLRLSPPANNNAYNAAEDYELENFIPISEELENSKIEFELRNNTGKDKSPTYTCVHCGKPLTSKTNTGLCMNCYLQSIKDKRPSRDELKELIRNKPFTQIGQMFGVTDNCIRKWCDAVGLPKRASDIKKMTKEEWELA